LSLPHASEIVPSLLAARRQAGRLLVGLDFDGTLTAIVDRPEDARLTSDTRVVLARLAERSDTCVAILSGRALDDVRDRVGIPGLYYAGNHGLEIAGPKLECMHPAALAALPELRAAAAELQQRLREVPGAMVEDKGVTLSVHYRMVAPAARSAVRDVALRSVSMRPGIRVTQGKMVVELRPDVEWHKGTALAFIRRSLPAGEAALAVFLGDDRTDEDAFRALGPEDWGVLVAATPPPRTAARSFLADPQEVVAFLRALLQAPGG